jgi:hypothetical protein
MFSRKSCYFFVRPKRNFLEVCVFLDRPLKAPQVRRVERASKSKIVNVIHITHRDEVEPPITEWLQRAYEICEAPVAKAKTSRVEQGSRATKSMKRVSGATKPRATVVRKARRRDS